MKLDLHNSKRKDAADNTMTSPDTTKRFKEDDGFESGDYGDVEENEAGKKYAEKVRASMKQRETNFWGRYAKRTIEVGTC